MINFKPPGARWFQINRIKEIEFFKKSKLTFNSFDSIHLCKGSRPDPVYTQESCGGCSARDNNRWVSFSALTLASALDLHQSNRENFTPNIGISDFRKSCCQLQESSTVSHTAGCCRQRECRLFKS